MGTTVKQRVEACVDTDHMKAWLRLAPDTELDFELNPLTPGEVVAALEAAKVAADDAVVARIDEFIKQIHEQSDQDNKRPGEFLIAEGRPPVEGEHGTFEWDESLTASEADDQEAQIDHRTVNTIRTVEKDAVIGKIVPPVPGTPGVDVHANTLSPRKRLETVTPQANVRLADDGQTVIATAAGYIVLDGTKLSIREVLEINGDVDFESGHVDATIDVNIRGTIQDLFEVKSKKSITVGGAVQAATLWAGEDILVRGGILSRDKGSVTAEGRIAAKFCDEATVHARGDLHVTKEAINSHLYTRGMLKAVRAAIIGGEVYARNGVEVHTLGSDACVATRVHLGTPLAVYKQAQKTEAGFKKQEESVQKIRDTVQPLIANLRRLTAAQKEKATELLYQAGGIEADIKAKRQELEAMFAAHRPAEPPGVTVHGRICQNVVIAINNRETHFHKEFKGPLRIEQRQIKNVTEFVVVNQLTGSITTLNSTDCDLSAVPDGIDPTPDADAAPVDSPAKA